MLLQTNSYVVPREKRAEHSRLVRRFRQTLARLGCDHFEVYEQVGANWSGSEATGRYVHIMRFRDRKHQVAVQQAERTDPGAQALINEFCELINFPYQQQHGLFAVGFYTSALPEASARELPHESAEQSEPEAEAETEPEIEPEVDAAADEPGEVEQQELRLVADDEPGEVGPDDTAAMDIRIEDEDEDEAAESRRRGGQH